MIDWEQQLLRALLFVPGTERRKLAKVATFGADAIVIDLEDAVADDEKTEARAVTREALPSYAGGPAIMVRVNGRATGRMADDLRAVVHPRLDAVVVPKLEDAETLREVDAVLDEAEAREGLARGHVRVLALVETALGLVRCEDALARAPERLVTAIFGLGDFTADLGIDLTADAAELAYARSRVVVAARAAGLRRPIDGPFLDLFNEEGLLADSARSRQLGYQGRVTVYPPQVDATQRAYSWLGDEEAERARRVVAAFEEGERRGVASLRVDGQFVDYPIYRRAVEKLRLYDAYRQSQPEPAR